MKKGDKVICIADDTKFYTPGKTYDVLAGEHDADLSNTLPQGWLLMNEEFNVKSDSGFVMFTKLDSENTTWEIVYEY